jgi:ATP-binding cassette subfamily C protein
MKIIKNIWAIITSKQRFIMGLLMGAILLNAALETLSIGLILPLVNLLNNMEAVQNYPVVVRFADFLDLTDNREILKYIFYLFIAVYIFKTVYFIFLTYFQQKFIAKILYSVSTRLLRVYLYNPWNFHLKHNSADLQNNIIIQAGAICTGLISSLVTISKELITAIAIIILLVIIDPITTLIAFILIGLVSLLFFFFIRGKLEGYGSIAQKFMAKMIKTVNEAFGGIKETKILGREDYYVKTFGKNNLEYAKSWVYPALIHQMQRSSVEIVFIGGIVAISLYILNTGQDTSRLLSILALFVAAAFRLMPSVNRMTLAISQIKFYTPILATIYDDIKIPLKNDKIAESDSQIVPPVSMLQKSIKLENVCFKYPDTEHNVLDSVSITIPKGYSVGFIGPSGAGKTTIVDIILGLLKPDSGKVLVDGYDIFKNMSLWQKQIGYIPQNIYLSDNTIRKNIAFGLDDDQIDDNKIWEAIKNAQLEEVVRKLPEGLDTWVGEHGLKISGGQRQRIGIARALYSDPTVLVLDEATSSLDTETERGISNSINKLSGEKTLLIIAHRITTVEKCDLQFYIRNGKIEKTVMKEKIIAD